MQCSGMIRSGPVHSACQSADQTSGFPCTTHTHRPTALPGLGKNTLGKTPGPCGGVLILCMHTLQLACYGGFILWIREAYKEAKEGID